MPRSSSHGRLTVSGWVAIGLALFVTFLGHGLYGANRDGLAVLLAAAEGLLVLVLIALPGVRDGWAERWPWLVAPAALFALVLLTALRPFALPPGAVEDRSAALLETIKLLGVACAFLAGVAVGAQDGRARRFLAGTALLTGLYALYAVAAFKLAPQRLVFEPKIMFPDRLTATFFSPNSAASLLGVGATLCAATVFGGLAQDRSTQARRNGRYLAAAAALAGLACLSALVLTASRGGAASTGAGLAGVVMAGLLANRRKLGPRAVIVAALTALALVGVFLLSGKGLTTRLGAVHFDDRAMLFREHWRAFQERPVFGWGLGSFDAVNKTRLSPDTYRFLWTVRAAHNVYLQWLEEAGVVGAALMWSAIAAVFAGIVRGLIVRQRARIWLWGIVGASAVLLLHGLTDYALQNPSIADAWAMALGVGLALGTGRSRRGRARDEAEDADDLDAEPALSGAAGRP
jgi:O-antigen ligase